MVVIVRVMVIGLRALHPRPDFGQGGFAGGRDVVTERRPVHGLGKARVVKPPPAVRGHGLHEIAGTENAADGFRRNDHVVGSLPEIGAASLAHVTGQDNPGGRLTAIDARRRFPPLQRWSFRYLPGNEAEEWRNGLKPWLIRQPRMRPRYGRIVEAGVWALACFLLTSCQAPTPSDSTARRIVSLDYCADQFVLGLADRQDILAVSPDAGAAFSYMRGAAAGLPTVRPRAEDVLALRPDLVVRSYGGGPNARGFFERARVPVLQIGFADDIEGARVVIRHAARGLGAPERGETLIAEMDARLRAARVHAPGTRALYMTPAGYTAGAGTLVDDLFAAAGLDNFPSRPGWRPIPLERLAYENPDLIARAAFGEGTNHDDAWTSFRHPVVRRAERSVPATVIDGATTSCGAWFLADAVAALAALHDKLPQAAP